LFVAHRSSLRGRSLPIEIFPLSFKEFVKFHELFADSPKTFGANTASLLRKAVKDYLEVGGFPKFKNWSPICVLKCYRGKLILSY